MPLLWTNENDSEIGPADWRIHNRPVATDARKIGKYERLEQVTRIAVWGVLAIWLAILATAIAIGLN